MSRNTAMVTGASAGIGEAYARRLAERGHDLVLVARDRGRLDALAGQLADRYGTSSEVLAADLTDPAARAAVEARLAERERPVHVLVNNAGFGAYGSFAQLDLDAQVGQIELNVVALVRLTHAALGPMLERRDGAILNISSVAGFQPTRLMATYGATKAFVTSFTQAVHEEVAGQGVRVCVQCPGFTRTGFADAADAADASAKVPGFLWQTADEVACAGLDGLARGKAVVVPGLPNKLLTATTGVLPNGVVRRVSSLLLR